MFFDGKLAENSKRSDQNIRRVRNGSCQSHILHAAVFVQLGKHVFLFDKFTCFFSEEYASYVEAQLYSDDLAKIRDKKSWNQSE